MAKKIQDGERQGGKRDFQGFVFEGKASESLTCNAIAQRHTHRQSGWNFSSESPRNSFEPAHFIR
jgi:hypothetical protein